MPMSRHRPDYAGSTIWNADMPPGDLIHLAEIIAARERIAPFVAPTPMLSPPGGPRLKAESLHPCGAFKIRGAFNWLLSLPYAQRAGGVIAPSSGNHAQAVAYAAQRLGIRALAVMPTSSPEAKRAGVRRWGADVKIVDPAIDGSAMAWAATHGPELGLTLIHPYDAREIIAGTGTLGLEILDDVTDPLTVYVPVSGGGLISGVAAAIRSVRSSVRIVGVEPELANDASRSFRDGRRQALPYAQTVRTMADGLRVEQVGQLTWSHIQALVDDMVTVTEDEIGDAVAWVAREGRIVAEPSGAVSVAAARRDAAPDRAVAIVSGGNVDPALYAALMNSGAVG